jgi:Uma2 family endonuclease
MIVRPQRITPEEFERMSGTDGYELIDGVPREVNMGGESSFVNNEFGSVIRDFVRANGLGFTFDSSCTFQCFPRNPGSVRKPDVSFVRRGRFPNDRIPRGHVRIPPDLAVEVVSPNDEWYEVERKLEDYLSAGVPLIWVVNPDVRTVHVYQSDGTVRRLRDADELTGEPVLPGFRVRLADLLPPPVPPEPDDVTPPDAP